MVGLVRVARKVDNTISKIGLNPAITGDPLGKGAGGMLVMMAARTVLSSAIHKASGSKSPSRPGGGSRTSASHYAGNNYAGGNNAHTYTGDTRSSFGSQSNSYTGGNSQAHSNQSSAQNQASAQNSQNTRFGDANTTANTNNRQSSQNASQSFGRSNAQSKSNVHFAGGTTVNTNRFGTVSPSHGGNNAFHSRPGPQSTGNMSPSPAPAAAPAAESGSHSPGNDSTRAAGTSPAQPNVRAFPGSRNPTSSGQPAFRRTQENSRPSAPASSRPSTYPGAGTSGASRPINRSFTPNGFHSARPIPQGQKPEPKGVPEQPQKQEEGSNE